MTDGPNHEHNESPNPPQHAAPHDATPHDAAHAPEHDSPFDASESRWEAGALSEEESRRLHEMEILARVEAEEAGAHRAPTELFLLMLAPLLLLALPLLLLFALRGGPSLTAQPTPLATLVPGQPTAIAWQSSFDSALQTARDSGKNVMVDFYSDT